MMTLTALEGFVVGDADVLEHVGVAGEHRRGGERQEDGGGEEGSGELVSHGWSTSKSMYFADKLCYWFDRPLVS